MSIGASTVPPDSFDIFFSQDSFAKECPKSSAASQAREKTRNHGSSWCTAREASPPAENTSELSAFTWRRLDFLENRKRIIEDPKKTRPKKILSQEGGPNVTTTISCPKFLLPPDERSDMQVTCFPAKPCLRAWIPWLPLSRSVPAKHFFWRIFVVHLLCLL